MDFIFISSCRPAHFHFLELLVGDGFLEPIITGRIDDIQRAGLEQGDVVNGIFQVMSAQDERLPVAGRGGDKTLEVLVEKAEVLEEVEEELETEKEMLIEKAVLLEKVEVELEAAKSVLSKEQAEVIEVELDAEETALAEEFELLGEAEAELKAEELELLDEAALLEETEEEAE